MSRHLEICQLDLEQVFAVVTLLAASGAPAVDGLTLAATLARCGKAL